MRCDHRALIVALALTGGCVPDGTDKRDLGHTPAPDDDGWVIATPAEAGFDTAALDAVYRWWLSEASPSTVRSLLVIRDGTLVAEGYARTLDDRARPRRVASVSKSVTSLLLGAAISDGVVGGVEDPLDRYLPEAFPPNATALHDLRLADLLTMRSGLDFDEDSDTEDLVLDHSGDSVRWILAHPVAHPAGEHFRYSSGDTHLVGAVVQRATGLSLLDYARARLFAPLGITAAQWDAGDDGLAFAHGSLWLRPRDLGKLGQLVLDGGQWNGSSVIPAAWITESVTPRANLNDGPYGYFWRIRPEQGGFTASGRGGNFVYVVPSERLVVIHTADPGVEWPAGLDLAVMDDLVDAIVDAIVASAQN